MIPVLLSLPLCLALNAPPRPKPAPPADAVEVQALALEIPTLPPNLHEAHAKYRTLRPLMAAQLQDLEDDLKRLYAQPGALSFHAGSLQVEEARKEEYQFLCSILRDSESEALEREVLKTWLGWQNRLLGTGLARRQDGVLHIKIGANDSLEDQAIPLILADPSPGEAVEVEVVPELSDHDRKIRKEAKRLLALPPSEPLHAQNSPGFPGAEMAWLMTINSSTDARSGQTTVNGDAVADDLNFLRKSTLNHTKAITDTKLTKREIPALSLQWKPLAEHLNHCAKRLLEYERQAPIDESPTFKLLRLRAKIAFLERFRNVLWFDSLVWATITTSSPPKPLASIRSEAGLGANIMRDGLSNGSTAILLPEVEQAFLPADCQFPRLLPLRTNLQPLPEEKTFEKRPWPGVDAFIQARIAPQSNPDLIAAFRRLARDAREFETVLRIFWREHPKVRLELQPLPPTSRTSRLKEKTSCGSLLLEPNGDGFHLIVLVQTGMADHGLDQAEPWLGQAVFMAFMTSRKGGVEAYKKGLAVDVETLAESWEFQRQLRLVLKRDHPETYQVMLLEAQERFKKGAW